MPAWPRFAPSLIGIFSLIAGICPCNSVLWLGLIGYLTSGETRLSLSAILKLTLALCPTPLIIQLPHGVIAGLSGTISSSSAMRRCRVRGKIRNVA